jgi:CheY-like chemotaxis protein
VRMATAELLRDLGASVVDMPNGEAMLKELAAHPQDYDVILTDYAMPGLAGDEAVRRARKIVETIPAVIVTGHANPRSLVSLPERTTLLNKPFTPAKLLHALNASREMAADA